MAQGRDKQLWNHTCSVIVALVNLWTDRELSVEEIHPYAPPREDVDHLSPRDSIQYLKSVYGNGR